MCVWGEVIHMLCIYSFFSFKIYLFGVCSTAMTRFLVGGQTQTDPRTFIIGLSKNVNVSHIGPKILCVWLIFFWGENCVEILTTAFSKSSLTYPVKGHGGCWHHAGSPQTSWILQILDPPKWRIGRAIMRTSYCEWKNSTNHSVSWWCLIDKICTKA